MPDYLPLSAFRQGLLPEACRSCAWWQSLGDDPQGDIAADRRRDWLPSVERQWGPAGILLYDPSARFDNGDPGRLAVTASLHFAPASCVPRFRALGFGPLPEDSALLFCLRFEGDGGRTASKRLIQKALSELRDRGIKEAYAVSQPSTHPDDEADCRFFSPDLLASCGFEPVASNGSLTLMRADLRGLLAVVDQVHAAVRRMLRNEPTPSPAAWSRPETRPRPASP